MAYLRGYISDDLTTLPINDTTSFPVNGGVIQIEDEVIRYETATDIALLGCVRGYQSTSNVEHDDKTEVELLTVSVPRFSVLELHGSGAPTDDLTGVGFANVGDRYTDSDTGTIYINTDNSETPTWVALSTGGPTQAAGDVAGTLQMTDGAGAFEAAEGLYWDGLLNFNILGGGMTFIDEEDVEAGYIVMGEDASEGIQMKSSAGFFMTNSGSVTAPHASSALELRSTSAGFLPPRMTTVQRAAIAAPAAGLMVWDTDLDAMCVFNGTDWYTLDMTVIA